MQNKPELVGYCPEMPEQVFRPVLALHNQVQDFSEQSHLLSKDVSLCTEFFNKAPQDQFWRRALVRSVFVLFEAVTFGLKRIALHQSEVYEVGFSPAELAMLKEEKYTLDSKGAAETQTKNFQRFIPNLRFAFSCFAKSHGIPFSIDLSNVTLKDFEDLRNRITHPKQLSDLTILDEEVKQTEKVAQWFMDLVSELIQKVDRKSLSVRKPRLGPSTFLNITKEFIVMQPDGNVYQFDALEEAEAYRDSKVVEDLPFMTPLLFSTEELRQQKDLD